MIAQLFFIGMIVAIEFVLLELRNNSVCVVSLNPDVFAKGYERQTSNGYRYCAYTGIPYAVPPVGENRFELPKKIPLWSGKMRFTKEPSACVQMSYETYDAIGSEDCLFLNIYTIMTTSRHMNEGNESSLMPVLFWIHGGSFNVGSSGEDLNNPDYIVEKDIVIVTINYRLGPFGFLAYGNVTRNIGLHDQRMALEWIHDNIIHFGGNKSSITLSGWSSGAASVSYHMYANKSRNLFDKAIMMSGNMLNPWAFESDVVPYTNQLLHQLKIDNSTDAVDELKAINAYDLVRPVVFSPELQILFLGSAQYCFVPTIDDEFVTQPPHINFRQQSPDVPILIGTTVLEQHWPISFEPGNFKYPNTNHTVYDSVLRFLYQIYEQDSDTMERFILHFEHASTMSYGIYKFIENFVSTSNKNVFLYQFAFDRAAHGDELKYLFKQDLTTQLRPGSVEMVTKQRMVAMWTNFIKFGTPTSTADEFLFNVTWPPFGIEKSEKRLLLNVDYNMTVERFNDNDGAFQLWDSIYQCLYNIECNELNEYLFNNKSIKF